MGPKFINENYQCKNQKLNKNKNLSAKFCVIAKMK